MDKVEEQLVSAALSNAAMLLYVLEHIPSAEYFTDINCKQLYSVMLRLNSQGITPTRALVIAESNYSEVVISAIRNITCVDLTIHETALIIKAVKRKYGLALLSQKYEIVSKQIEAGMDAFSAMSKFAISIDDIVEKCSTDDATPLHQATLELVSDIEKSQGQSLGLPLPFASISKFINVMPPDFLLIAARPGIGKTALAVQIAKHMQLNGLSIAYFSLEMKAKQLAVRVAVSTLDETGNRILDGLSSSLIRAGKVDDINLSKLRDIAEAQASEKAKFAIYDNNELGYIVSSLYRLKRQNVKVVFIDYIQLINISGYKGNRADMVAEISRTLKRIANKLNIAIIAMAQLNREVLKEKSTRPELGHLRNSGDLEQDADQVLMLYRVSDDDERVGVHVAKNRHGAISYPNSDPMLEFIKAESRFVDVLYGLDNINQIIPNSQTTPF